MWSAYTAKSHYFEEESMNKYHLEENVSQANDNPVVVNVHTTLEEWHQQQY